MLVLILAVFVGQTAAPASKVPSTLIVTSKRTGLSVERSNAVAAQLSTYLSELGVPLHEAVEDSAKRLSSEGFPDSADCGGNRECVAKLGIVLRRPAVIGIQLGEVGDEIALHLELVDSKTAGKLAHATFVLPPAAGKADWMKPLKPFAVQVRAALSAFPDDAPLLADQLKLEPSGVDSPVVTTPAERRSKVPAYALAGGSVALVGLGAATFVVASNQRASLYGPRRDDGTYSPATTRTEAEGRAQIYNRNYTVAASAGLVSLAIAAGAYLLWPKDP